MTLQTDVPSRAEPGLAPVGVDFHPDEAYFALPRRSFGDTSVVIAIGPLRMVLTGLARGQASLLRTRFEPFVVPPASSPDLRVSVRDAGVEAFLRSPEVGVAETYRLKSRTSGRRVVLWSYEFAGWFNPVSREAGVSLVAPEGPLFERGMENFLRVLVASLSLDLGASFCTERG